LPLELSVFVTACLGINYFSVLPFPTLFYLYLCTSSLLCLLPIFSSNVQHLSSFPLLLPFISTFSLSFLYLFPPFYPYLYLLLITFHKHHIESCVVNRKKSNKNAYKKLALMTIFSSSAIKVRSLLLT